MEVPARTAERLRSVEVRARLRVDVSDDRCTYWVELDSIDGRMCRLDLASARLLADQVQSKVRVAARMAAEQARAPVPAPDCRGRTRPAAGGATVGTLVGPWLSHGPTGGSGPDAGCAGRSTQR